VNRLNPIESKKNQNMKTNSKMIFSAALAATLIALPGARAATSGAATTNTMAEATATTTNGKPADLLASLFGDPVVAKGTGFEIKQSQLDAASDAFKAQTVARGQSVPQSELVKAALNSLIVNQLLLQQATAADKAQGKKDADQIIEQTIKRFGSQTEVERQLKAVGKTIDGWRTDTTQQMTATAVLIRVLNAAPPEAEIKKYYDDNPKASEMPEMAHVRHILLLTIDPATRAPLSDDQLKAKKKQIDDILKQLRGGADFAKLAKQYSEDPGSKDDGGDLPPFARASVDPTHAMVQEFETAAFSLTNNQISDVITTQYGYHVLQLLEKTPAKKLALTDKVPSNDATTLSDAIKDFLTKQKLQEQAPAYMDKMSKSPGVEILDPDLKAMMAAATNAPAASVVPAPK
jgi:parvulin-like peptidyl-prolyl isomerase